MRRREWLLAGAGALLARPAFARAAATLDQNGDIIKPLIAREEAAAIAYRGTLPAGAPPLARFAAEHVAALRTEFQALGRGVASLRADQLDPVAQRVLDAAGPRARLAAAIALEADLLTAYRGAVLELTEPGILQTTASILAGHAQQHALLARLAGHDPFALAAGSKRP